MPGTHFCNKETIKGVESFPCIYWLEVYSPTLQRWVPIDPFHIWIDEPGLVEDSYKKWKLHPFRQRIVYPVYITAVENVHVNGEQVTIIRDVTLRYICGSIIRKQRLQDTFWSHTLEALSCCDDISSSDNCIASEQREWEYWENKEPIPKSRNR